MIFVNVVTVTLIQMRKLQQRVLVLNVQLIRTRSMTLMMKVWS